MDPRFPPAFYGPCASGLGHKARKKNLQYRPRTWLIEGIYSLLIKFLQGLLFYFFIFFEFMKPQKTNLFKHIVT